MLLSEKKPLIEKELLNHANNENLTALQLACMRGHYDGALMLLKCKADATIVKGYGFRHPLIFRADTPQRRPSSLCSHVRRESWAR